MSDSKKYYYMRLKENFFESEALVLLESMPDGILYSNILLKMYLKSLKNEGRLMFNDYIPYNPQMIATVTRHQVGTVEKALDIFKELGLIEILTNGAIYMNDIQLFIGKTSTEGDRKKKARMKIEAEKKNLNGQMSDIHPPELEIEIKIEKESEEEGASSTAPSENPIIFYETNIGLLSPLQMQELWDWNDTFNGQTDILIYAMKIALDRNKKNMGFVKYLLNDWLNKGAKTLSDVHALEVEWKGAVKSEVSKGTIKGSPSKYDFNRRRDL